MTAKHHNAAIRAGTRRAELLEPRLAAAVRPILGRAGDRAAVAFQARATDFLTAAARAADRETLGQFTVAERRKLMASLAVTGSQPGVTSTSTMVCLKPTAEQAAALAEAEPENMHVTLAFLGDVEGDLRPVVEALRQVALHHAPLSGTVGGVGVFDDLGDGHPHILLPDVPGLVELRVAATEALARAGISYARDHGFAAHLTVKYDADPQVPDTASLGAPLSFADLFVVRGDQEAHALPLVGRPPLTAGAIVAKSDKGLAIGEVAARHAPDGGYGAAWNAGDATVFWIYGDWSSDDEVDSAVADFLAIDGVEQVDYEAEAALPEGDEWEIVYKTGATGLTADAGPPQWRAPAPDEIIDVPALIAEIRAKTDPVRKALIEAVMGTALAEHGLSFDVTNPFTNRVLEQSGSQIVNIAETTQLNVMRIIRGSYEEGLSIPDTATAIRAGMRDASLSRSINIARTELVGAVNGGSLAATQIVKEATGENYSKTWMTAPGAPFPRHELYEGLDGQTAALEGYFSVGGDELQYPGDPAGSPEEVCQCRCTMRYDTPEGEEEVDADGG